MTKGLTMTDEEVNKQFALLETWIPRAAFEREFSVKSRSDIAAVLKPSSIPLLLEDDCE